MQPVTTRRGVLAGMLLPAFLPASVALANPLSLEWDDLLPTLEPLSDPLAGVDPLLRFDLGYVAQVQRDAREGRIRQDGAEYRNAMRILDDLRARNPDADRMVGRVMARDNELATRRQKTRDDLDGQSVRMAGYALPLELSGEGVTEFLLVPYVGACIHVPPPPPNQIVYAKLSEPYEMDGLYSPVWISGRMTTGVARPALSFVDGTSEVATGYQMQVERVEPYE
ncbi:MAG: DUF3299 domain-containing protein [Pseudomonadota bacterium]